MFDNDMDYFRSMEQYQNRLTYRAYQIGEQSVRKVVVLGNSITRHGVRKEVGWLSDYGMAASSTESDFCHVLQEGFWSQNPDVVVVFKNIAAWERDFSVDKELLMGAVLEDADVVIVRLEENSPISSVLHISNGLTSLVDYIRETAGASVVITGCFWMSPKKNTILRRVAASLNLLYISLSFADHPYNKVINDGDATDTLGNIYHFNGQFVGTHPNDKGVRMIADALLPMFVVSK